MKKTLVRFGTTLTVMLTGCVSSIHPIYTEKELVYDEALLGVWHSTKPESNETYHVTRTGERAYHLVLTDNNEKQGDFHVHLASVQGTLFLNVQPAKLPLESRFPNLWNIHIIRGHFFCMVEQIEPELKIKILDIDWLEQHLENEPSAIDHTILTHASNNEQGKIVLTASTEKLQQFAIKHLKTPGAFTDSESLRKEISDAEQVP